MYPNNLDSLKQARIQSGPKSPPSEPVDFSAPPRPGFSHLVQAPYSRESTPDSGTSHYIDAYRGDTNGM